MQSKKKIIIVSVSNDIVTDQRVHKVCKTLNDIDYKPIILGRKLKKSLPINLNFYQHKRFKLWFNKGFLFYANLNIKIFFYLLFRKFDCLLANDLDTLPANLLISKIKNKKLFYDSHELFTEVPELLQRKFVKSVWLKIEKICLPRVYRAYTVSQPIADYYKNKYNKNFYLVRNLPYLNTNVSDFKNRQNILIYQGALNKHRGLENLIEAMIFINDYKLIIAGEGDLSAELREFVKRLKLSDKVIFIGRKTQSELLEITQQAKLGFSVEQNTNLNYYYALPNKMFDYINAGVPVFCSDLPEMSKIINNYKLGFTNSETEPKKMAQNISKLLSDNQLLYDYHKNCINAAKYMCWEKEEVVIKEIYAD